MLQARRCPAIFNYSFHNHYMCLGISSLEKLVAAEVVSMLQFKFSIFKSNVVFFRQS